MKSLLSADQMKKLDSRTINEFGMPARILMETAGKGCADLLWNQYPEFLQGSVCVICGAGNNGGDGAVIARWLWQYGARVFILRYGSGKCSPETDANLQLCAKLGIQIDALEDIDPKHLYLYTEYCSMVIDAVFGIGVSGELRADAIELIEAINELDAFVVSVDIPSGLNADTGYCETAVEADLTLAIESLKLGHLISDGRRYCGTLEVIPIGIPDQYYDIMHTAWLMERSDFDPPERDPYAHKSNNGKVYVFGGIPGFTGASVLASQAALRAGAGYVYVLHRMEMIGIYAGKLTEALSMAILEDASGDLPDLNFLGHLLADAAAVVIGPGLGQDDFALECLRYVMQNCEVPVVLDADALNLISQNRSLLKLLKRPNLLCTPHWGEFCRLAKLDKADLEQDCMKHLSAFVRKYKARVLLKSHTTIYHETGITRVNICGNDGLATGGSGDVLAGIIGAFLAQGHSPAQAAINASILLGITAENLAGKRATPSILPSDIIANLFVTEIGEG